MDTAGPACPQGPGGREPPSSSFPFWDWPKGKGHAKGLYLGLAVPAVGEEVRNHARHSLLGALVPCKQVLALGAAEEGM